MTKANQVSRLFCRNEEGHPLLSGDTQPCGKANPYGVQNLSPSPSATSGIFANLAGSFYMRNLRTIYNHTVKNSHHRTIRADMSIQE